MRAVRAKALRKLAYAAQQKETAYQTLSVPKQVELAGGSMTTYTPIQVSTGARRIYQATKKIWVIKKVMPNLLGGTK